MFHFTAQRYCTVQLRLRGYFLLKRPLLRIYRHPELVICDVHTTTTVRGRRPNVFGALRYRHTHCRPRIAPFPARVSRRTPSREITPALNISLALASENHLDTKGEAPLKLIKSGCFIVRCFACSRFLSGSCSRASRDVAKVAMSRGRYCCCCFLKLQASLRLCLRARYAISDTPSACTLSSSRQSQVGAIYVVLPWVTLSRH